MKKKKLYPRQRDRFFERLEQSRQENSPPSLPKTRPRSLTLPLPVDRELEPNPNFKSRPGWCHKLFAKLRPTQSIKQHTLDQKQSPLFGKLPAELRELIWGYFFNAYSLHIVRVRAPSKSTGHGRLGAIRCAEYPYIFSCNHCWGYPATNRGTITRGEALYYNGQPKESRAEEVDFVSLFRTCRRIYCETVDLPYKRYRFEFNHVDTMINLYPTLLPHRFNQIHFVKFTFNFPARPNNLQFDIDAWVKACSVLAMMPGLEELRVHLHWGDNILTPGHPAAILNPLLQIRQPKVFNVHILFEGGRFSHYHVAHMPFQLIFESREC